MRKLWSMNYQNKYDSCKTLSAFNTVDEQLIVTVMDILDTYDKRKLSWSDDIQIAPAGKFFDSDSE